MNKTVSIVQGLNKAQTTAVLNPLASCTKIVAGAGTGKTKIISKRFTKLVFDLIEQGETLPYSKILVITFTDKAANEMRERIVKELEENSINVLNAQDLWVSTFHSFCIRILRKYSIEAGLSPSFKIGDEQHLEEIYNNLVKYIKYGEAQTIDNIDDVLLKTGLDKNILSVESLGKLTVLTDIDVLFDDIFGVIKKIKALGLSPKEFLSVSLGAIDGYSECVQSVPFKFETKEDYASAWAEHFRKYTDDSCTFDENVFDSIAKTKLILDKFGKRKAIEYGMAQGFPENIAPVSQVEKLATKVIAAIYALYQAELEKYDMVDFDDLINKTIGIFKKNELIKKYYQNYFKQIIVDEFQDTNGAQLELIELLLNPDYPDLTYVGDRKQSIYAFRYAQTENLEVLHQNVERRYSQKFEPINLSINYRSTPEVLHAVNYVTTNELNLKNENLSANPNLTYPDTSKDVKVTTIKDFDGAYDLRVKEAEYIANEIQELIERDNAQYKDFAVLVKSHSQADMIEKELLKKDIPAVKKVNTGYFEHPVVKNLIAAFSLVKNSQDEQALFRLLKVKLNDSQIYNLKKQLDEELLKTMEFDEVKRLNFAQKYNAVAANKSDLSDNGSTLPSRQQDEITADDLFTHIDSVYKTVNYIKKNQSTLKLMQILEILKTEIPLFKTTPNTKEYEFAQAQNNIKTFEKITDDYAQNEANISVSAFVNYLLKIKDDKNFELPSADVLEVNAVQLLTIHASKGLEFPYVFVLSVTAASKNADKSSIIFDMQYGDKSGFGIIANKYKGKPTPKALVYKQVWQKPREESETLRLFYGAVSRAKKYLNVLNFESYSSVKPAEYVENLNVYLNL